MNNSLHEIICIKFHEFIYFHKRGDVFWAIWTGDLKPKTGQLKGTIKKSEQGKKQIPKDDWHICNNPMMVNADLQKMFLTYEKMFYMYFPKCFWHPHIWGVPFNHKKYNKVMRMCKECGTFEDVNVE